MIRLGVSSKIIHPRMPRMPAGHFSVRLLWLLDVLHYLVSQRIYYYRLPGALLENAQVDDYDACGPFLDEIRQYMVANQLRLTAHPAVPLALGGGAEGQRQRVEEVLARQAALLDALGCGPESVLVMHVGGSHDDAPCSIEQFARRYELLPPAVQRRIALEPDHTGFDICGVLQLHQYTGAPVVFDTLHHQLNNPHGLSAAEAFGYACATWRGVTPEVHVSTQRTEGHLQRERGVAHVIPPRHGQHADFINPFELATFLRTVQQHVPFDLMLEAKAGDLALLRLRQDLARFAPEVACFMEKYEV